MPMPPMPMKCVGPISRGSFMRFLGFYVPKWRPFYRGLFMNGVSMNEMDGRNKSACSVGLVIWNRSSPHYTSGLYRGCRGERPAMNAHQRAYFGEVIVLQGSANGPNL